MDRNQADKYRKNHEQILRAMKDSDHLLTAVKLSKSTGLSRKTVYKHLYAMEGIALVVKEHSGFRLNRLWPLTISLEQELKKALKYASDPPPTEVIIPLGPKHIMTVREKVRIFTKLNGTADICPACHQVVGGRSASSTP